MGDVGREVVVTPPQVDYLSMEPSLSLQDTSSVLMTGQITSIGENVSDDLTTIFLHVVAMILSPVCSFFQCGVGNAISGHESSLASSCYWYQL